MAVHVDAYISALPDEGWSVVMPSVVLALSV